MMTQDKATTDHQSQVVKLAEIDSKTYSVTVRRRDGTEVETLCRLIQALGPEGDPIEAFDFDSDVFQRQIALGEINARNVYKAVVDFKESKEGA